MPTPPSSQALALHSADGGAPSPCPPSSALITGAAPSPPPSEQPSGTGAEEAKQAPQRGTGVAEEVKEAPCEAAVHNDAQEDAEDKAAEDDAAAASSPPVIGSKRHMVHGHQVKPAHERSCGGLSYAK